MTTNDADKIIAEHDAMGHDAIGCGCLDHTHYGDPMPDPTLVQRCEDHQDERDVTDADREDAAQLAADRLYRADEACVFDGGWCQHRPAFHDRAEPVCGVCGEASEETVAATIRASAIRDAILAVRPKAEVTVEQTGGGTATMYVGPWSVDPRDGAGYAMVAIGPGSYDWGQAWDSRFYPEDLCVGPDDDGTAEPVFAKTAADVAEYVAKVVPA